MFDLDLYEQTHIDLVMIDCNANFITNSFIADVNGSTEVLFYNLIDNKLLKRVEIDLTKKAISFSCAVEGFRFVREMVPIVSGGDSLVYRGHLDPHLNREIEIYDLSSDKKSIIVIRKISSDNSTDINDYEDLFSSINNHLSECIDSLNMAIDEHNESIKEGALRAAKYLHEWYVNRPEEFKYREG